MNVFRNWSDAARTLDSRTRLRFLMVLAAILVLVVAWSEASSRIERLEKKRTAREKDLQEMMLLSARYRAAKTGAGSVGTRMAAVRADDTLARIVEETGIRGRALQVRPLKGEDRPGQPEELGEIRVEGLTLNEAVNLLHRLEKGPKPVVIRKSLVKTRFDDPSKVDVTLTAALLKPAPRQ